MDLLAEPDKILSVNKLTTQFDQTIAVDGISFEVTKGETIGIVGESGSGKSVTALSIMQLVPSGAGKISHGEIELNTSRFGKCDLNKLSEKQMQRVRGEDVAMIFQEPMTSLNPVFTCGEQITEAILLHREFSKKEARDLTIDLFHQVLLPDPDKIFKSYPHEISGGQKQRVMIAMAMSCQPQLLIADEPTTALDVTVQASIIDLMRRLKEQLEMSIIFITHDLSVIAEIADRVLVMYQGKIVEQGTIWEIFSNPRHPYTKGLLACRPRMDIRLNTLPTISDFMGVDRNGQMVEKKYNSVGEALLFSAQTDDEIAARRKLVEDGEVILKVKNLKKYFPVNQTLFGASADVFKAVDDVSFEVHAGETLGLVGESGCGKTTLGRAILKLIEPTGGEVYFEGEDLFKLKPKALQRLRKDIQIIFQDPYSSLNPRLPIGAAIVEPMKIHQVGENQRDRKQMALDLLEKVQLKSDFFYRYPHELSGGQRQRVCIARTLALEPKFIICDESVSALDVSVQAQVLNLLNSLKREFNFTYIFISHDLAVVKFISDRVMVMNQGVIVESGYPDQIYQSPQNPYTKKLIEAIPKGDIEDIRKAQLKRSRIKLPSK